MEPLLTVEGLTKTFTTREKNTFPGVNGVSFQLREGETLGIVGQSGCGKSTLAKLIVRLLEPTSGSIRLAGEDITHARGTSLRHVYQHVQMVFQSPMGSFDPRRTIGYSIGESLRNTGMPKAQRVQQVAALLEQCGLPAEFSRRCPHQLSGGQCQRAAIARALAIQPKLLICDEATSALDVTVQQQILELLKTLKRQTNLSLLFICHNLALVQAFCDRVLVMWEGKILEEGTPDSLISAPQSQYTKQLVEAASILAAPGLYPSPADPLKKL